ncbi:LysR family transcriptional regulator [Companilactobacillus zhongbaensis]|uniref:LysR family transcriptional regulator n=1 Tax=Companilactobacillus zhongbaensis TaxID=2486009 RepID=UPI000F794012|nr:LysR family transcriptional regulator [Companilactobacillus zhongbaensis]
MDIHQIKYLITIVNNDFNLTRSAKILGVSQPALSKLINEVEKSEQIQIFTHGKGRITGLTPLGDDLIANGRQVSADFDKMMQSMRDSSNLKRGTAKIGIPSIIISTVFTEAIPKFIRVNPDINLQIVERGGYELKKLLISQEIDLAIIPSPVIDPSVETVEIFRDSVSVWFNKEHRFSQLHSPIPLDEISKENIVTFNNEFILAHELQSIFQQHHINKDFYFQTSAWDLILNMCKEMTNAVGIVPTPIMQNYSGQIDHEDLDPVYPWTINICNLNNTYSSNIVKYTKNWFVDFFKNHETSATPVNN